MSLHPFTTYIVIKVYTEFRDCTANCKIEPFFFLETCTSKLRFERACSVVGITGLPLRKSSLMSGNRPCQSKMIALEYVFPLLYSLKKVPCYCGRPFTICTELDDCSLLEMRRGSAFLINSATSHVESDSH